MQWIKQKRSPLVGKQAEERARHFLQSKGLEFVTSNFRCRGGEIDLIMKDGQQWVFVEVKYRSSNSHGAAAEFFHHAKRKKFTLALQHFMHKNRLNPAMVEHRIDLVAIDGSNVEWLKSI